MLPPRWGDRLGSWLGATAYRLGWRRDVVERQIGRSFPERDRGWIRRVARASFEHVGREAVSLAATHRHGLSAVREQVESFENLEALRSAVDGGRGLVMVSGHFGNWELAGSTLAAYGFPVDVVVQGLSNTLLDRRIRGVREAMGMRVIDRADAWNRLRASLSDGRVVAFVADQDARERGVFVPFFGRSASTHRAPALLAIRADAPLFVGGVHRIGPRRYHAWVVPIERHPADRDDRPVRQLTRRWSEELERRIRLFPEQYFWHHKRWKTSPPGTARERAGITNGESG